MPTEFASIATDLASFLTCHRQALARAWAKLVCEIPASSYRTIPLKRLEVWMAQRLDAIGEALASGSLEQLDARLASVAPPQLQRHFTIGEVIHGLLLAKEAALPFMWEHAGGDGALLVRWIGQLDACLRHAAGRFGAQYAAIGVQQIRAQEQRTALMLDAAQTASSSLEIDQVLARSAASMASALGARECGIYLLDAARTSLALRATAGARPEPPHAYVFPLDPGADPLLAAVLARKAPVTFPDEADGAPAPAAPTFDQRALLALPILAPAERLLGVAIIVGSDAAQRFTAAQVALAWGIARAVALAIDNAQLYADLRRKLAESESARRITAALLRKLSLPDVLEIVCGEALRLTGAQGSAVLLNHAEQLHIARSAGRFPSAGCVPIVAPLQGQLALVASNESGPLLAAPLLVAGTSIGTIVVASKPEEFTADDLRVVAILADQAAVAIHNAQLYEQIGQLAAIAERQRLAHDLHDSVAQSLYSLALYTKAASGALSDGAHGTASQHLHQIQCIAEDALHEMRQIVFNLHMPQLEREGLVAALQARLDDVEARAGLHTQLTYQGDEQLALATKEALYHIAQEALNNTLKHGQAQHVALRLTFGAAATYLEIHDNGRGFDTEHATRSGGLGLRGMAERVQQLGGRLSICSAPGAGTSISVEVPL